MTKQAGEKLELAKTEPFVIKRVLGATRELVFKVWTEPEHVKQWFTPKGFTMIACNIDLRPGGVNHYGMTGPNDLEMWGKAIYREIVPPERLVYVQSFSDKDGNITRHPLSPTWPREMLTTITFKDVNGKTEVIVEWIPVNASDEEIKTFNDSRDGMKGGWTGTFTQLDAYLQKVGA